MTTGAMRLLDEDNVRVDEQAHKGSPFDGCQVAVRAEEGSGVPGDASKVPAVWVQLGLGIEWPWLCGR